MAGRWLPLLLDAARCNVRVIPAPRGCAGTHLTWRSAAALETWPTSHTAGLSSSANNSEGVDKLLDMISANPQLQQMMMAALPKPMQRPEVLQGILQNPAIRKQVAEMISKQGLGLPAGALNMMDPQRLSHSLEQSKSMGLDPSTMFQKLMAHPGLMQKFREPRIVSAFFDIVQDQRNLAKYQNDKEIVEVYFAAKEILLPSAAAGQSERQASVDQPTVTILSPPQGANPQAAHSATIVDATATPAEAARNPAVESHHSTAASPGTGFGQPAADPVTEARQAATEATSSASQQAQFQDASLSQLMRDPERLARLTAAGTNPRIQKALTDISQSRWKVLLYMFDKEVMAALKDLGDVAKEAAQKQVQEGKR